MFSIANLQLLLCMYTWAVELPPLKDEFVLIQLHELGLEFEVSSDLIQRRAAAVTLELGHDGERQHRKQNHSNHMTVERDVHERNSTHIHTAIQAARRAQKRKVPRAVVHRRVLAPDRNVALGVQRQRHLKLPGPLQHQRKTQHQVDKKRPRPNHQQT